MFKANISSNGGVCVTFFFIVCFRLDSLSVSSFTKLEKIWEDNICIDNLSEIFLKCVINLILNLPSVIRKDPNERRAYIFTIDLFFITEAVLSSPDKLPFNIWHITTKITYKWLYSFF